MRRVIFGILAVWVVGFAVTAAIAQAPPATAPAVVAMPYPRVEIFPFTAVPQPGQIEWIGRAIQESLQSDVSKTGATLLIPPHAPVPGDDAVAVARQNKADLAVVGSYQIVGDDVRVNGHLINLATDVTVGSFSATGPQKNLFQIEDALGEQMRRLLPISPASQQMEQAFEQQPSVTPPPVIYQSAPEPQPTAGYYYNTPPYDAYGYPGYYPGYYDAYPLGLYGGIGFYGVSGYGLGHRGYDDRGFHNYSHLTPNPTFHNPVFRGSTGGSIGGSRFAPALGFRGGGGIASGGFHGGGGRR